ncbi:hypothetical protein IAU60_002918 [Kwoniella sp. DSM 27419]
MAVGNRQVQLAALVLASLPPLTILLYSNLSLRRATPSPGPSPVIALLPLVIFLLSVPPVIISPSSEALNLVLLPLTLMMALRGGAGVSAGGVQEGVWSVGLKLNMLSTMGLVQPVASLAELSLTSLLPSALALAWHVILGAPWYSIVPPALPPIAYWPVLRTVFAIAWFWGMKKLIQDAWAMGGLSGHRVRPDIKVS